MKHLLLQVALLVLCFSASAQTSRTTRKAVTHQAWAKAKVNTKARPATGPQVYYCNSGNTVKYPDFLSGSFPSRLPFSPAPVDVFPA